MAPGLANAGPPGREMSSFCIQSIKVVPTTLYTCFAPQTIVYNRQKHAIKMIVQISDIFVVVTAAAIFSIRFFFSIRLLISAFFYPPFTIRIFSSASAIRRYPVRVLQTPFLPKDWVARNWVIRNLRRTQLAIQDEQLYAFNVILFIYLFIFMFPVTRYACFQDLARAKSETTIKKFII